MLTPTTLICIIGMATNLPLQRLVRAEREKSAVHPLFSILLRKCAELLGRPRRIGVSNFPAGRT